MLARDARLFIATLPSEPATFTDVVTGATVEVGVVPASDEPGLTFYDLSGLASVHPYVVSNLGCDDTLKVAFTITEDDDTEAPEWSGWGEVAYDCRRFQGRGCGGAEEIDLTLDEATDDSGAVLYEVVLESPLETSTVFMTEAVATLGYTQCGKNLDHDLTAGVIARVRAVDLSGNATDFVEFTPKGECRTSCGCQTGAVDLSGLWAGAAGVVFARRRRAAR